LACAPRKIRETDRRRRRKKTDRQAGRHVESVPHVEGGALPAEDLLGIWIGYDLILSYLMDRNVCCANGRVILPIGD
jgi:hypothetical protein